MTLYQDLKKISQELIEEKNNSSKKYNIEKHNYKDCYMFQVFENDTCLHCEVQYNEKSAELCANAWLEDYKEGK